MKVGARGFFWGRSLFSTLNRGHPRRTLPSLSVLFTLMSLVIWLPSPEQIRSSKSGVGGGGWAEGFLEAGHTKSVKT